MGAGGTVTEGGSAIPGPRAGEGRRGCSGWRTRGWCAVVEALVADGWSLESRDADGSESGIDGEGEDGVAVVDDEAVEWSKSRKSRNYRAVQLAVG